MKTVRWLLCGGLLLCSAWNGVCAPVDEEAFTIAVFHDCNLDAGIAASVADHVREHTGAPVRVAPCLDLKERAVEVFSDVVVKGLKPNDRVAIALYAMGTNETDHTILTVKKDDALFAMIDLRTLVRDDPKRSLTDKLVVRRVQKESLRAVSALVGLPDCPILLCTSRRHENIEKLDEKSYNFCPPCRIKTEDLLRARGMTVKSQVEQMRDRLERQPDS